MENKLQKICRTYYNLLMVQELWQAYYQILSIIFLKEFIELNVNSDMTIKKNVKLAELRANHATVLLNRQDHLIELKMILYNTIVYVATKNINRFNEKFKKRIFNTNKFSNRDNNKLFNVCEEMFILMNI